VYSALCILCLFLLINSACLWWSMSNILQMNIKLSIKKPQTHSSVRFWFLTLSKSLLPICVVLSVKTHWNWFLAHKNLLLYVNIHRLYIQAWAIPKAKMLTPHLPHQLDELCIPYASVFELREALQLQLNVFQFKLLHVTSSYIVLQTVSSYYLLFQVTWSHCKFRCESCYFKFTQVTSLHF